MKAHFTSILFAVAYTLMIISSLYLVKSNASLADVVFLTRLLVYGLIFSVWFLGIASTLKVDKRILIFVLPCFPYLLTNGYMAYIDTAILLIAAHQISRLPNRQKYFVKLAYASLFLVVFCAVAAKFGLIATTVFEFGERAKATYGFGNPNNLYYYVFTSAFIFYRWKVTKGFVICGFVLVVLYPSVESRTFMIAYLLLAAFWAANPKWIKSSKIFFLWCWLGGALTLGMLMCVFPLEVSIALSYITGIDINELLSNRLDVINNQSAGRTMLSILFGGVENTADSLYVYLANGFGVVGLISFELLVVLLVRKHLASKNVRALTMACVYLTAALVEAPYSGSALVAIFFIWMLLYRADLTNTANTQTIPKIPEVKGT